MLLLIDPHKFLKLNVALNRIDFPVDLLHYFISAAFCLWLGHLVAITKSVPFFLLLNLILPNQHLAPVSYIPIWSRPILPKHTWHLVFSSRHSFSFQWLGESWLDPRYTTTVE